MIGIEIVAAVADGNQVIGLNGSIPWNLRRDLRHFTRITKGGDEAPNIVVMGMRTWNSLPKKPLSGRINCVLTRNIEAECDGAIVCNSVERVISMFTSGRTRFPDQKLMVIGGTQVYKEFLPHCSVMHITHVHGSFLGDTFFPQVDWGQWQKVESADFNADEENQYPFSISVYERL